MSKEQLKAFQEAVNADAGLQEKLKAAGDAGAVLAIAKAAGLVISVEELEAAVSARSRELSDEELESVPGGTNVIEGGMIADLLVGRDVPAQS